MFRFAPRNGQRPEVGQNTLCIGVLYSLRTDRSLLQLQRYYRPVLIASLCSVADEDMQLKKAAAGQKRPRR